MLSRVAVQPLFSIQGGSRTNRYLKMYSSTEGLERVSLRSEKMSLQTLFGSALQFLCSSYSERAMDLPCSVVPCIEGGRSKCDSLCCHQQASHGFEFNFE